MGLWFYCSTSQAARQQTAVGGFHKKSRRMQKFLTNARALWYADKQQANAPRAGKGPAVVTACREPPVDGKAALCGRTDRPARQPGPNAPLRRGKSGRFGSVTGRARHRTGTEGPPFRAAKRVVPRRICTSAGLRLFAANAKGAEVCFLCRPGKGEGKYAHTGQNLPRRLHPARGGP